MSANFKSRISAVRRNYDHAAGVLRENLERFDGALHLRRAFPSAAGIDVFVQGTYHELQVAEEQYMAARAAAFLNHQRPPESAMQDTRKDTIDWGRHRGLRITWSVRPTWQGFVATIETIETKNYVHERDCKRWPTQFAMAVEDWLAADWAARYDDEDERGYIPPIGCGVSAEWHRASMASRRRANVLLAEMGQAA